LLAEGNVAKLKELDRKRPINIDNCGEVKEERTVINSYSDGRGAGETRGFRTAIEKEERDWDLEGYEGYLRENKALLDEFIDANWAGCRRLLTDHGNELVNQHSANYLLLQCLAEEMEGNRRRHLRVGERSQMVSQIIELAKSFDRPPRDMVNSFYEKMDKEEDAKIQFLEETKLFCERVQQRAVEKHKEKAAEPEKLSSGTRRRSDPEKEGVERVPLIEAMYHMSKEDRQGPGGLDPVEVFESLPVEMQESFKSKDIDKLQQIAMSMDEAEFERQMQRCVDAGLWSV